MEARVWKKGSFAKLVISALDHAQNLEKTVIPAQDRVLCWQTGMSRQVTLLLQRGQVRSKAGQTFGSHHLRASSDSRSQSFALLPSVPIYVIPGTRDQS